MGRRKGEMKRCHLCEGIMRRCYVELFRNGRHTHLTVGWLCPRCEAFLWEIERRLYLSYDRRRKPKKRCACGAPMLRLYVKQPKTQRFIGIGWLCLREFSHTTDTLNLKALNAEE